MCSVVFFRFYCHGKQRMQRIEYRQIAMKSLLSMKSAATITAYTNNEAGVKSISASFTSYCMS